jgi:hypothetical protein
MHPKSIPSPRTPQNVNCINPGFNANGNNAWLATTVANGHTAVKKSIRQSYGTNFPAGPTPANTSIPIVMPKHHRNVKRNFRRITGTSAKKLVSLASLLVAPHDISMLQRWQRIAWETCRLIPPRKTVSMGTQVKFSRRDVKRAFSSVR